MDAKRVLYLTFGRTLAWSGLRAIAPTATPSDRVVSHVSVIPQAVSGSARGGELWGGAAGESTATDKRPVRG